MDNKPNISAFKGFNFPSFENWQDNKCIYSETIGVYVCRINTVDINTIYAGGTQCLSSIVVYAIDPSHEIFNTYILYSPDEIDDVEDWYTQMTFETNRSFEEYMMETYTDRLYEYDGEYIEGEESNDE